MSVKRAGTRGARNASPGHARGSAPSHALRVARWAPLLVALFGAAVALAGCTSLQAIVARRVDEKSFQVGATTQLVVQSFNGLINATAGGDGSANVKVTSRGTGGSQDDAQRDLVNIAVSIDQSADTITVIAKRTDNPTLGTNSGADVEVTLPRASSVQLSTSNGRVQAVNVTGAITVRTSNAEVTTRQGANVDVETSNGSLTVANPGGTLKLHTSNGGVDVLGATSVTADVETSNGQISFNGSLAAGPQTFDTSNASISLQLPPDAAFSVDAHTSNGSVRSDFPLTVTKDGLSGQVGTGGAQIRASTSNGDLSLRKLAP